MDGMSGLAQNLGILEDGQVPHELDLRSLKFINKEPLETHLAGTCCVHSGDLRKLT